MELQIKTPTEEITRETKKENVKKVIRRIKFEAELDHNFGEYISEKAYGQKLLGCIQCGTCSATCPLSHYMDFTPRKIIAMTREGFREEVLNSLTIWLCASCYSCYVDCPREIHITEIMYALKREAIKRGYYPKRLPIPILAREFYKYVFKNGRNTESRVLVSLYFRTNPFRMLKEAILGLKLMLRGRFKLGKEKIKNMDQLHAILETGNGGIQK